MQFINSSNNNESLLRCPICDGDRVFRGPRGLKIHCSRMHVPRVDVSVNQTIFSAADTGTDGDRSNDPIHTRLAYFKKNIKLVKRIPKGARLTVARSLTECIAKVVSENSTNAWYDLLTFAYKILNIGNRSAKISLTNLIKQNSTNKIIPLIQTAPKFNSNFETNSSNKLKIVENKLSEGDTKGAIKLLFSDDSLAVHSPDTLGALREKHPTTAASPTRGTDHKQISLRVTEEATDRAIRSFSNGSAGGLDGISPQHLKDLTDPFLGDVRKDLLRELTSLLNLMLAGRVPSDITPILYGANLVALKKKDGGIRPIAVGCTLRRLASKLCCREYRERLTQRFKPRQLGFGVNGGCEAAVHAARSFLLHQNFDVFVKIDVKNAFNSVDRGALLSEIQKEVPEIFEYMWQCYGTPSKLLFGDNIIESCVGCQQGDPLGPVIFSLAIQPIIDELNSKFNVWYLDDGSLGGTASSVLEDLDIIIRRFDQIGLSLNFNKCEILFSDNLSTEKITSLSQQFNIITPNISIMKKRKFVIIGCSNIF